MAQLQPHRSKEMVSPSSLLSSTEEEGSDTTYYRRGFHAQLTRQLQEDTNCWSQVGEDITGESANDQSGFSLAMSANGKRIAIGAWLNDGNGGNSGHVRIYQVDGTTRTQLGFDIDGEAGNDRLGTSVALSADGNRVIIGAPFNNDNGNLSGHARVFELVVGSSAATSTWVQLGADIDGEAVGDWFGFSVAISGDGNRIIVGAPLSDENFSNSGHARVFDLVVGSSVATSTWGQLGADFVGEDAFGQSGTSVALSADGIRVIIGARLNDENGYNSGHARVFELVVDSSAATSTWVQLGAGIDGEAAGDQCGTSVAISANGDRVIIGAPLSDGNGDNSGHARVFELVVGSSAATSTWVQLGADIDGEFEGALFGQSVAITADGNRVIIGARNDDSNARIFDLVDIAWIPTELAINGEAAFDESGNSVAMAADGNLIVIGAPRNDGNGPGSGHVRLFKAEVRCLQCPSFLRLAF
jgi:hypothetical protein